MLRRVDKNYSFRFKKLPAGSPNSFKQILDRCLIPLPQLDEQHENNDHLVHAEQS